MFFTCIENDKSDKTVTPKSRHEDRHLSVQNMTNIEDRQQTDTRDGRKGNWQQT